MRKLRIVQEPGRTRLVRSPDLKAILLLLLFEAFLFIAWWAVPLPFRAVFIVVTSIPAAIILWPRIEGEEITLTPHGVEYRHGIWPFWWGVTVGWGNFEAPRITNPGVRGWRGPICFYDSRTGETHRIGPGLQPADCRRLLATVEEFRARRAFTS
jgi:hypothetical protein